MRLEIKDITKADIFVQCFQHMKTFTDSINITFNEDSMYIQCMDSGMTLIMEFRLMSSWFDLYEVTTPITIGLMTNLWSKVLSIRDKTQTIALNTTDKPDHLSVLYHVDNSKTVFDKSFEVPLVDIDSELLQIPETEYPAEFSMPSISFASLIGQLKQFGDNLTIECTEEHIHLVAESQEYGKMNTHIPIEDLEEYAINENATVSCTYGLRMLHNICLYQKISKSIMLGVSSDFPMKTEYNMGDDAFLSFYLAPRITD